MRRLIGKLAKKGEGLQVSWSKVRKLTDKMPKSKIWPKVRRLIGKLAKK